MPYGHHANNMIQIHDKILSFSVICQHVRVKTALFLLRRISVLLNFCCPSQMSILRQAAIVSNFAPQHGAKCARGDTVWKGMRSGSKSFKKKKVKWEIAKWHRRIEAIIHCVTRQQLNYQLLENYSRLLTSHSACSKRESHHDHIDLPSYCSSHLSTNSFKERVQIERVRLYAKCHGERSCGVLPLEHIILNS